MTENETKQLTKKLTAQLTTEIKEQLTKELFCKFYGNQEALIEGYEKLLREKQEKITELELNLVKERFIRPVRSLLD